jgi:hypothetical protein
MRWSSVGIRTAAVAAVAVTGAGLVTAPASAGGNHVGSGTTYMKPFNASDANKAAHGHGGGGGGGGGAGVNLTYHGGVGGIGVETAPVVYLVFWGSQWSNDPSSEAGTLQGFIGAASGSAWLGSVTQYCQGVASGTVNCGSAGQHPSGAVTIGGVFNDNSASAPHSPTQSQLASEAIKAAHQFGSAISNLKTVQFVIATSHGNNSSGFGSQYCAYHSSVSTSAGYLAYTNLPYITDAGASCGANFNDLGANAGITIVEGHEMAETMTDQFPNGGWLDGQGEENGDKCAWITKDNPGASAIGPGNYPVQSLWSNLANAGAGGCVPS